MAGSAVVAIVGEIVSDYAGAAVADYVGGSLIATAAGDVIGMAAGIAVASGLGLLNQSQTASGANRGINENISSTVEPIPIIYGKRKIAGTRVFVGAANADNADLWLVIVHCEGEVQGGAEWYFDDVSALDGRFVGSGIAVPPAPGVLAAESWSGAWIAPGMSVSYALTALYGQTESPIGPATTFTNTSAVNDETGIGSPVSVDVYCPESVPSGVTGYNLYRQVSGQWQFVASIGTNYASPFTDTSGHTGSQTPPTSAPVSQWYALTLHTGTDAQAADAGMIAAFPGKWTSAHQLCGLAYTVAKLTYSSSVWGNLPNLAAVLEGRKLYDPRTGATAYGNNAALVIRDYLKNGRYGRGLSSAQIDVASFSAAADLCDTLGYTINGVIDTAQTPLVNLTAMLAACRGWLIYTGGKYRILLDRPWTGECFDFNESNITGSWKISQPGKQDKFNRIRATWINPANNWQPDIVTIDDAELRNSVDNGILLESQLDLTCVTDQVQAQHLAMQALKASRFGIKVEFTALPEGLRAEVGNVVTITHSTPGWTAKKFRVLKIVLQDNDEVQITAQEYDDSVYSYVLPSASTPAPATSLPNPFAIPAPTNLVLSDAPLVLQDGTVVPRILVSWSAPGYAYVTGYDVRWKKSADTDWNSETVTVTQASIQPVEAGQQYDIEVFSKTPFATSQACLSVTGHTASGQVMPPPAIPSLSASAGMFQIDLAWPLPATQRTDLDYIELWAATTDNRGAAARITVVPWPGTSYAHVGLQPGQQWYYWARVVDTTGNDSAWYPASATGGIPCAPSSDPSALLTQLHQAVGLDQIATDLATPIQAAAGLSDTLTWDELTADINRKGGKTLVQAERVHAFAQVDTETTQRVADNEALAQQIITVQAGLDGAVASIATEATARANQDGVLAQSISTVQTSLNGQIASVSSQASATASTVSGMQAKYVLTVNANGQVAGMEMISGANGSSVVWLADKFAFCKPDGTGGAVQVVTVGTVNGVSTVGVNGAMVIDGSLSVRALAAGTATLGSATISFTNGSADHLLALDGNTTYGAIRGNNQNSASAAARFTNSSSGTVSVGAETTAGVRLALGGATAYAVKSDKGTIGPFTSAHEGVVPPDFIAEPGDILVDVRLLLRHRLDDTLLQQAMSTAPNQPAIGVFAGARPITIDPPVSLLAPESTVDNVVFNADFTALGLAADWQAIMFNAGGEGLINVCGEGGDLRNGDLIVTSSTPGKGMRQADDVIRASTVAKCRETVTFSGPGDMRQVACIYLCG